MGYYTFRNRRNKNEVKPVVVEAEVKFESKVEVEEPKKPVKRGKKGDA